MAEQRSPDSMTTWARSTRCIARVAAASPLAVAVLGCAADAPHNEVRVAHGSDQSAGRMATPSTHRNAPASGPRIVLSTHRVAVGDVEVSFGTPVEDLPYEFGRATSTTGDCETAMADRRLELLSTDGILRRARATGAGVDTPSGISVGTDVEVLEEIFPRRLQRESVGGEELIVFVPSAEGERDRRMIFETRDGRVTEIRAGLIPWVYWESCP